MSVITSGQLETSVNAYRHQQETIKQQLVALAAQKVQGERTVDVLEGAIQACLALIQNIKNEDEAQAAKLAAETAVGAKLEVLPVPAGLPSYDGALDAEVAHDREHSDASNA